MVQGKERILPMDAKAQNQDLVAQRKKDLKAGRPLYLREFQNLKGSSL